MTGPAGRRREWPALRLELWPSRSLVAGIALVHGLAVMGFAWMPWPFGLRVILILGVVTMAGSAIREHGLRSARGSLRALEWRSDGSWHADLVGRGWSEVRRAGDGFVHPRLVVIGFDGTGRRRRYLVAAPDSADSDSLRRLRVRLLLDRRRDGVGDPGRHR